MYLPCLYGCFRYINFLIYLLVALLRCKMFLVFNRCFNINYNLEKMTEIEKQKAKLEIEKLENENRKLEKEIEKLAEEKSKTEAEKNEIVKSWYLKTSWWSVITTFLIGTGGFYIALQTNIFGIQQLKVEKKSLQDSITIEKNQLAQYRTTLKVYSDSLQGISDSLQKFKKTSDDKIKVLSATKDELAFQIAKIKKENLRQINQLRRTLIDQQIEVIQKTNDLLNRDITGINKAAKSINLPGFGKMDMFLSQIKDQIIKTNEKKIDSLTRIKASIK
jgi:hypothetical protein